MTPPFSGFFAWVGFLAALAVATLFLWTLGFALVRAAWQAGLMVRMWNINRTYEAVPTPRSIRANTVTFLRLFRQEFGASLSPYTTISGPWGTLGYLPWHETRRRAAEEAAWDAEDKGTA